MITPGFIAPVLTQQDTDFICADCSRPVCYLDEVFRVQVMRPNIVDARLVFQHELQETDDGMNFRYDPYCYCNECWEKNYEEFRAEVKDEPPVLDDQSALECSSCASGIRENELVGVVTLGEFRISDRAPNGVRGPSFTSISHDDILCIYCLLVLNQKQIEMWESLCEHDECDDCVHIRCWRGDNCGCRCHYDPIEE